MWCLGLEKPQGSTGGKKREKYCIAFFPPQTNRKRQKRRTLLERDITPRRTECERSTRWLGYNTPFAFPRSSVSLTDQLHRLWPCRSASFVGVSPTTPTNHFASGSEKSGYFASMGCLLQQRRLRFCLRPAVHSELLPEQKAEQRTYRKLTH